MSFTGHGHATFEKLTQKLEPDELDITHKVTECGLKNMKTYCRNGVRSSC